MFSQNYRIALKSLFQKRRLGSLNQQTSTNRLELIRFYDESNQNHKQIISNIKTNNLTSVKLIERIHSIDSIILVNSLIK